MADSFSSVACSVARVSVLSRWLVILMLVWLMHFMLSCQWKISFLLLFNFLQIKTLRFSLPIFSNWQLYSGSLTLQAPYTFNTMHQLLQNAFALNFFLFLFVTATQHWPLIVLQRFFFAHIFMVGYPAIYVLAYFSISAIKY